jgi:cytoskeletal protein CcmA (bactofilin family)
MAWNRTPDTEPLPSAPRPSSGGSQAGAAATRPSTLGPTISIKGNLKGAEDLRIEGSVEGTIRFDKQSVVISESGRIKADVFARSICVEGEVTGNLYGEREITIRPSGKLEGNITAPSVTLENGAKFRGSIDMEPTTKKDAERAAAPAKATDKSRTAAALSTPATAESTSG